jgi:hypothetical protein
MLPASAAIKSVTDLVNLRVFRLVSVKKISSPFPPPPTHALNYFVQPTLEIVLGKSEVCEVLLCSVDLY